MEIELLEGCSKLKRGVETLISLLEGPGVFFKFFVGLMRDYQKLTPPWVICHALYCQNIQDEPKSRGDRSRVVFFKFNNPPETYGFPE